MSSQRYFRLLVSAHAFCSEYRASVLRGAMRTQSYDAVARLARAGTRGRLLVATLDSRWFSWSDAEYVEEISPLEALGKKES